MSSFPPRLRSAPPSVRIALAAWLAATAAFAAGAGEASAERWYAQAFVRGDKDFQVTHFWSEGPKLRAETVIQGHRIVTIVDGPRYYAYDAVLGRGIAVQRSPKAVEQDAERGRPFGLEGERLIAEGAERVGTERLGGRECELYRLSDAVARREICVTTGEEKLPLRVELFHRAKGQTVRTDYVVWSHPEELSAHLFAPDPRFEIVELGYQEFLEKQGEGGPVGPVPILYGNLLHGD